MNLTKRLNKAQAFTIYHLATDSEDADKIFKQSSDGKTFYTFSPLASNYKGNAMFASLSKTSFVTTKPSDKFFVEKTWNLADTCKDFGACYKNDEIPYDKELDNKTVYITNDPGYGDSSLSVSEIARKIIGLATIKLELGKNLPVLNLINIGEPVTLITKTLEYNNVSGKYLLKSSDIVFRKDTAGWVTNCSIAIMRTNKEI